MMSVDMIHDIGTRGTYEFLFQSVNVIIRMIGSSTIGHAKAGRGKGRSRGSLGVEVGTERVRRRRHTTVKVNMR